MITSNETYINTHFPTLPFPEEYSYTETVSEMVLNEPSKWSRALLILKDIVYSPLAIFQIIYISIDVGIHALFYNAITATNMIDAPEIDNQPFLQKIKLLFNFFVKRLWLSARLYIIDHWIFQKDMTNDRLQEIEEAKNPPEFPIDSKILLNSEIDTLVIENSDYEKWIIYVPGMKDSNVMSRKYLHNIAKQMNINIICPNPRGVGNSKGMCREAEDFFYSAEAAYEYLATDKGVEDNNITVWGHSLGGASAANLAASHDIKVILDRTFTSFDAATEYFPYAPYPCNKLLSWLTRQSLDVSTQEATENIDPERVLIISAEGDNVIDFDYASAKNLDITAKRFFCTFKEGETDPGERMVLSHSGMHTPKVLNQINAEFIENIEEVTE